MQILIYDIGALPFFSPDHLDGGEPATVTVFKEAIADADALLIATPEYNGGIPGVLKNALDLASPPPQGSVLIGKPAAILGCTTGLGGTVRAQMQLRQTLQYTRVQALLHPELFVSRARDKFDLRGQLSDQPTRDALSDLLAQLLDWTRCMQVAGIAPAARAHGTSGWNGDPGAARRTRVAPAAV